jgi:hypothetical protein
MTVLSDSRCYHEGAMSSFPDSDLHSDNVCTAQDTLQNLPITVGTLRRVGTSRYANTHHA